MADKLRSVNTRFWDDTFISELNPSEKLLFLYLITNPLTNLLGIYEITMKRISFDTGLKTDTIQKGFERFGRVKKVFFVDNFIILPNWLKNQRLNANMKIAVSKEFNSLPDVLKDNILGNGSEGLPNDSEGFRMVRERLGKYEIEIESKIEERKYIKEEFLSIFNRWLEYKKDKKQSYKNEDSIEMAYKKLYKFADGNPKIATEIVEQSLANNWDGMFKLKQDKTNSNHSPF